MPGNSRQKLKCDAHIDLFVCPKNAECTDNGEKNGSVLSGMTDFL